VQVNYLRSGFKAMLEEAAALPIEPEEKTPLAKTVRTCRRLLKVEPALWTFVYTSDVEPTNNAAERALQPAVIWRRLYVSEPEFLERRLYYPGNQIGWLGKILMHGM
jgi:hypothetical protein